MIYLIAKIIWAQSSSTNGVDAYALRRYLPLPPVSKGSIQYSVWDFGSFSKILDFSSQGWGMYLLFCYRCFSPTTLPPVATLLLGLFVAFVTATPGAAPQLRSSAAGPHPVTNLLVLSPSCQIQKWIVRDEIKTEPPRHFCRGQDRKWICCWWGTNGGGCSSQPGIYVWELQMWSLDLISSYY